MPTSKDDATTLSHFNSINSDTLEKTVRSLSSSTSELDVLPTKFFKTIFHLISADILQIINTSLQTGIFPTSLKTAVVKPLLKKASLDASTPSNYRPISNLPFIGKVLEKVVFTQVSAFLTATCCFDLYQSGFREHHSTETALIKVVNDIRTNNDAGKTTVLMLLDLSAAFDTVDHHILLHRLEHWVGLSGTVLSWLRSYLENRSFYVAIGNFKSEPMPLSCGVPQGSILGPLLFNLYMLPLGALIKQHSISYHSYADDTQIYLSLSPDDLSPMDSLYQCFTDINTWMSQNFLQLNTEKTEVITFGKENQRNKLAAQLNTKGFKAVDSVRNLGVILDSDLTFSSHIKSVTKSAFYHLKKNSKLKKCFSYVDQEKLIHAFITSRVDYCNGLFTGLPQKNIKHLQIIQNAAARLLTQTKKRDHITPVLRFLHWLPVSFRIDFKVLLLAFKCLQNQGPLYLKNMLRIYCPTRSLRSGELLMLVQPSARTKQGEAAFSNYAVRLWNQLPLDIKTAPTVATFKTKLKTKLFRDAFN